jgi:hypothetical protein
MSGGVQGQSRPDEETLSRRQPRRWAVIGLHIAGRSQWTLPCVCNHAGGKFKQLYQNVRLCNAS